MADSSGTVVAARTTDRAGYYRFDALPADRSGTIVGTAASGPGEDYVIEGVPDGHYTLTAHSYPPASAQLQVTAAPQPPCDIQLDYPGEE